MKNARHQQILDLLEKEKYISAAKLARTLYVSLPTVRRDLAELERQGMLIRSHGGASQLCDGTHEIPFEFRSSYGQQQKGRICAEAARLINEGDLVFIDGSTTALHIADHLSKKQGLTVLTNGIYVATHLMARGIKTICTGGEVMQSSLAFAGGFAEDFLENFVIDIAFISTYGMSLDGSVTDTSLAETRLRRRVMARAKRTVFLFHDEKLGQEASYRLCGAEDFDLIISNSDFSSRLCGKCGKIIVAK